MFKKYKHGTFNDPQKGTEICANMHDNYACTRTKGHKGWHIAGVGGDFAVCRWLGTKYEHFDEPKKHDNTPNEAVQAGGCGTLAAPLPSLRHAQN